jgi:hypothetical protein
VRRALEVEGPRDAASAAADAGKAGDDTAFNFELAPIDIARVGGVTLTAGMLWWMTRSGGLLTMMLMGIPAWRHMDMLPVLARRGDDESSGEDSDTEDDPDDSALDGSDSGHGLLHEHEVGQLFAAQGQPTERAQ